MGLDIEGEAGVCFVEIDDILEAGDDAAQFYKVKFFSFLSFGYGAEKECKLNRWMILQKVGHFSLWKCTIHGFSFSALSTYFIIARKISKKQHAKGTGNELFS